MAFDCGSGKDSWPELVGERGAAAAEIIEHENPNVNAIVELDGTGSTRDIDCERVWVWINEEGVVIRIPRIG